VRKEESMPKQAEVDALRAEVDALRAEVQLLRTMQAAHVCPQVYYPVYPQPYVWPQPYVAQPYQIWCGTAEAAATIDVPTSVAAGCAGMAQTYTVVQT
jgi:hypothetical protein